MSKSSRRRLRERIDRMYAEGRGHEIKVPHGLSGYINYGCRCQVCDSAARARAQGYQAQTTATAVNVGLAWTDEEIEVACDPNLTAIQAAQQLGRTMWGVMGVRRRHGRAER